MVIGILGGMGSYATLDIFDRLLEAFPAQKEWERPRIVIDNNCTMPSRVIAALHGTDLARLVAQMTDSVRHLLEAGCTHIFFACNTSHIFLDDVYARIPEARGKIYNIIECLAQDLAAGHVDTPLALIATEGTIQTGIYQSVFAPYRLRITPPHCLTGARSPRCARSLRASSSTRFATATATSSSRSSSISVCPPSSSAARNSPCFTAPTGRKSTGRASPSTTP